MELEVCLDSNNPPMGLRMAATLAEETGVRANWTNETKLSWNNGIAVSSSTIYRILARRFPALYCNTAYERTEVDYWLGFAESQLVKPTAENLQKLDGILKLSSFLVGNQLTVADLAVFDKLAGRREALVKFLNINRYYNFIEAAIVDTIPRSDVSKMKDLKTVPIEVGAGDAGKRFVGFTNIKKEGQQKPGKQAGGGEGESKKKPEKASGNKDNGKGEDKNNQPGGGDKGKKKDEGKFVELPGAEMGKVVVRFPPEASGYLHIGHAKAALLNQYYQLMFNGKLIMRFDDTNPAKEKEAFEEVILQDLEMLQVKPDRFTYTSDYFELMLELCEKLLKADKAYVDDTEAEVMKDERMKRIESKNRSNAIDKNLQMWNEMKNGTAYGQKCCVRAKIDMNAANGCMRDPTIYRCKPEHHPRTGNKYKVYPTYDFACPIVDSIEGVTHALRTTEYHDRDDQFFWFIDALGLRKPYIYEYSRLNLTNTVLSKRKLTWFVDEGAVDGWDDPRFPTVRGVLRRGMTVEGLKQFIVAQGSSRSVVMMSWDKIWAFNRQVIDPIAPRHTGLMQGFLIPVNVKGAAEIVDVADAHPKNPEVGKRNVWKSGKVLVEEDDAVLFKEGENVTFVNWGNIKIEKINRKGDKIESVDASLNLDDKDFKKTMKITWLAETAKSPLTPIEAVYYDHIISKPVLNPDEDFKQFLGQNTKVKVDMVGDADMRNLKKGDIVQLQRKGFFICDVPYKPRSAHTCKETPLVLFAVPDGKTKENPTVRIPGKQGQNLAGQIEPKKEAGSGLDSNVSSAAASLDAQIIAQGNKIRDLKSQKATKDVIEVEVKALLAFKTEFKSVVGKDWDPKGNNVPKTEAAPVAAVPNNAIASLDAQIVAQGNKIRDLKGQKAAKDVIEGEVKALLALKVDFKKAAGKDWDPKGNNVPKSEPAAAQITSSASSSDSLVSLDNQITEQGGKIRDLKSQKAAKDVLDVEVKKLLALKAEFKKVAGKDWDPKGNNVPKTSSSSVTAPAPTTTSSSSSNNSELVSIDAQITAQGSKIRDLKSQKAGKDVIDAEVKKLLGLKADFKKAAGKDWDPKGNNVPQNTTAPAPTTASSSTSNNSELGSLDAQITAQGNKIRVLKSQKAAKDVLDAEVKTLLSLKADFKKVAGKDWDPKGNNISKSQTVASQASAQSSMSESDSALASIDAQITAQGNRVRELKGQKATKDAIDAEVKALLALKAEFKKVAGRDWDPKGNNTGGASKPSAENTSGSSGGNQKSKGKENKPAKPSKDTPKPAAAKESQADAGKKQTRLCVEAKKSENLAEWFSQVITKSEMIEYYDVSGCYIFRPWSFAIWEAIKDWFDGEIKKLGVQNCYFPMFVSQAALQKEKDHIADFAPEVAWVTKSGDSDLAEPIAIRPTSETVMYPSFAKWVQSHRDLPIKLNQWNNVVRWEFKHPQPFIRTREFLWQEGHSAFATYEEAEEEVYAILCLYERVYTELLAIPVIPGRKTEKEKFPGGDYTTTVEAYISASGRGLQGATSHHLGQNFSKMFKISFEDPKSPEKECFAYQNSWGLSTRTIGAMVMVHGDDQGLVLPPRVAATQVVIVPCGITASLKDDEREALYAECKSYETRLSKLGLRVKGDYRENYSPGWKFNHWELKGVPLRIEVGPRDLKESQYVAVQRHDGSKGTYKNASLERDVKNLLDDIHNAMFQKAQKEMDANITVTEDWQALCADLDKKHIIMAPFCGRVECEENIKKDSAKDEPSEPGAPAMGAKSLCIPFKQPKDLQSSTKCIHPKCNQKPKSYTLFGRSY
ncbi:Bifunctional glutamate/proline--tRNA ligase [Orchesella cincta]|uniref:Bifunctional glutamate/proline--tRNA ligase n=1 Tax=Orchesella cincta TaxID=48709 RepID=A0A1D2MRC6_ORCCI|nr:Bifunctional glutamate/proline--tRNA ligase [Orchesella cincta]